jgi:predicted RNA-binding Zn ribbon-like protein
MRLELRRRCTFTAEIRDDACLDFANTLSWRGRATPVETLADPGDLARWVAGSAVANIADEIEEQAPALLAEAIALREAIFRIFRAVARGKAVPDQDLAALNRALAAAPPRHRIVRAEDGYGWRIGPAEISAPTLLAPVLWSAGDLLASERRRHVRLCANDECLWLFLDESKAGTRRWCNMAACGNRAKARRHYQRTRPRSEPGVGRSA